MSDTHNTQDLSQYGYRELDMAADLLKAYCRTSPDFLNGGISIEFNMNSGYVFLVDEDYTVGMMNGDDIEQWFNCPICGNEGFLQEMIDDGAECCHAFLMEGGLAEEMEILESKVRIGETSSGSTRIEDIVDGVSHLLTEDIVNEWDMYAPDDPDDEAAMAGIFEEIFDHLNDISPVGVVFGASDNDKLSYGFWKIDELETSFISPDDEQSLLKEWVRLGDQLEEVITKIEELNARTRIFE